MVVWTGLSDEQRAMYTEFVESKDSLAAQAREGYLKSPLLAITWLKKLCGHPRLTDKTGEGANLQCMSVDNVLSQSAKLVVLVDLVQSLKEEGHRPLIFSQSTKMLDVIAFVLRHRAVLSRIDGRTPGKDRQRLVDDFNQEDSQYDVMLLSTKAAGCGLTLTGADTAIVYDPSW
jgi:DNA excision repair protein ERCC-6